MMSRQTSASEEVFSDEGSQVESPPIYHPSESHTRFNANVVFVQHVVTPIMILEYIPVYINYQTYEPYLINSYQVEYVPFFRQAYINSYIPYYYRYQVSEIPPVSEQIQYDTTYNSYQGSSLDTSLYDESTYTDDTNSSTTDSDDTSVLSLSSPDFYNSYEDSEVRSFQDTPDTFQDLVSDEHSFDRENDEFNNAGKYPQEVCNADDEDRIIEVDDPSLPLMFEGDEERSVKSGLKSLEKVAESSLKNVEKETDSRHVLSEECDNHGNYDDRSDIESDISFTSLFLDAEKTGGFKDLKQVEAYSLKNVEKETDSRHVLSEECDNHAIYDDRSDIESVISFTSLFVDAEKTGGFKDLKQVEEYSLKNAEKETDSRHILSEECDNHGNYDDRSDIESVISFTSLFLDAEKTGGFKDLKQVEEYSLKNVEKEIDPSHLLSDGCDNHGNFDDRNDIESDISCTFAFVDAEKPRGLDSKEVGESSLKNVEKELDLSHVLPARCKHNVNSDDTSDIESDISYISSFADVENSGDLKIEESSLKNGGKELDLSQVLPDRRDNQVNFYDSSDIEYRIPSLSSFVHDEKSGDLKDLEKIEEFSLENSAVLADRCDNHVNFDNSDHEDSFISSVSSLDHVTKCQDENNLKHSQLSSFKNKSVKRCEMSPRTATQVSPESHKISLQEPESLHNFDVNIPGLSHDVISDSDNDSDGDPAISLQDILTSDEYLKVKREECMQKRRSSNLYRSCLEGDIHPRRPLPQVGTMATIFEDLPYPINEPYDSGIQEVEESWTDDESDSHPLEVEMERSNSRATLLPRKKRFRNTRKFFSRLFRCFRPP